MNETQIAPIQNSVYLTSMAVIAGARTWHQVRATVKAGFWPVMKVSWITSPLALAFAQKFLPEQTWVPFFNIVAFTIGTYINTHTKKKRLAALRKRVSSPLDAPFLESSTFTDCVNSIMAAVMEEANLAALMRDTSDKLRVQISLEKKLVSRLINPIVSTSTLSDFGFLH